MHSYAIQDLIKIIMSEFESNLDAKPKYANSITPALLIYNYNEYGMVLARCGSIV